VENNGVTPPKLVPSTMTEPPFIVADAALLLINEAEDGSGDHAMTPVGSSTKGTHK
jgi:hypothetical protein